MKKCVLLILFLLLFTGFVNAQQNFDPNMSISQIQKNTVFPEQKQASQELYGFTYMINLPDGVPYRYVADSWSKVIDNGTLSRRVKGALDDKPYNIVLSVKSPEPKYFLDPYSRPGPAGYIEQTKKYLDEIIAQRKKQIHSTSEENGVGDYSLLLEQNNGRVSIITLRGPFIFEVSSLPYFKTSALSVEAEVSDTFQITDIVETVASHEAIDNKLPDWRAAQKAALVRLMKDFLANFETWYDAPVAGMRGDGFKGYFWPDPEPFYLTASELPKGMVIEKTPDFSAANIAGSASYLVPKSKGEKYTLSFDIRKPYGTDDNIASSLEFTKEDFTAAVAAMKKPETLQLPGADEAYRMVWQHKGNNDKIIFRRDNIIVTVTGISPQKKQSPNPFTINIARIVAAKINTLAIK